MAVVFVGVIDNDDVFITMMLLTQSLLKNVLIKNSDEIET